LIGLAISLAGAECGLRAAGLSYPSFYTVDERRGVALRPGSEGWFLREGESYVRINADGLRDREHPFAKPSGALRIAVLGDSYALAKQVALRDTFWSVMQRELSHCAGLSAGPIEVINFGVSGYSTAQELVTLRHRVWRYEPDVVLLAFTTGNDVRDNHRGLARDELRPFFRVVDGALERDDSFRRLPAYRAKTTRAARLGYILLDHSRVAQVINEAANVLARRRAAKWGERVGKGRRPPGAAGLEIGLSPEVYRPPQDPRWVEAWYVTEKILAAMNAEVTARGSDFWVVTLTTAIQVHPDPAVRARFREALGLGDLFYADRRVGAVGAREGFPVLNLAPLLQAQAERGGVFLHGFENTRLGKGHWNERGHAAAGRAIAGALCRGLPHRFPQGPPSKLPPLREAAAPRGNVS
jgi:hypothetical protein